MIPIKDLIVGATYAGQGRDFDRGYWTGNAFRGLQYKLGHPFGNDEFHWAYDRRHGTFIPFELIEYPDTLVGAVYRLRDACRELRAMTKELALADWQRIKKLGVAIRAALKSVLTKEFPW